MSQMQIITQMKTVALFELVTLCGTATCTFFIYHRLTDNLVALKEIRLEHEEGAPCTAIREGE